MKMKGKRLISIILLLVLILILTTPVLATDRYQTWRYPRNQTIVFTPHQGFGDTTISHFNEALYQWNQASGYTLLRREPIIRHSSTIFPLVPDGNNRIYRGDYYDVSAPGFSKAYYSQSGIVYEADIALNTLYRFSNGACNNQYDVWTVFIHEAGHVLGLDHPSTVMSTSVMQVLPINSIRRALNTTDKSMLNQRLY